MSETAQPREVEVNWNAIKNISAEMEGTTPPPPVEKKEEEEEKPIIEEETLKIEPSPVEVEALKIEAKELGLEETATAEVIAAKKLETEKPVGELNLEDLEGFEKEAPEGSWLAVAQAEGLKIQNDTWDDVKAAIIAPYIKQAEEAKTMAVENLFQTLKPETVANLKLLEMGVPEAELFEPTKKIENYLALDNLALVRADKEAMGWNAEMIDAEMELLTSKNLVDHEANKLRLMLNETKAGIVKERQTYIEQYESKKEQAILAQQELEKNHFKEAMNTVSSFMERPLSNEIKEELIRRYNKGMYKEELSKPDAQVQYILYKEFHKKLIPILKNTAFSNGQEEQRKKLLSIPPQTNSNVGTRTEPITKSNEPFSVISNIAKEMQ